MGPSAFKLIELKKNPIWPKNRFAFKFILPHLYFKGDYDMDMNILLLKYRGQGQIIGNFTNYDAEVVMKGHLKNIGGSNHLEFERFDMRLNLGHSYFFLDNLFKDQPTLAKATLDVITDNSELFANEVRPAIENALADVFTDIANKITSRFTYEELFPRN
ncbi:hypothetical protein NQ317_011157 [Molorchus minor]|uniref:Protein takeout n=1 Tax=Molorchus minor TaxID=1323400 RepID=A0ABQ9JEU0_9CUCU|nr:hypothetical protein NQ317_011157 [Molorchus minor]